MTLLLGLTAVLLLLIGAAGMVQPWQRNAAPTGRHRGTGRQTRTGVRRLRQQGVQ